jgi:hypothetical protein
MTCEALRGVGKANGSHYWINGAIEQTKPLHGASAQTERRQRRGLAPILAMTAFFVFL